MSFSSFEMRFCALNSRLYGIQAFYVHHLGLQIDSASTGQIFKVWVLTVDISQTDR